MVASLKEVEQLAMQLSLAERRALVERLVFALQSEAGDRRPPCDLAGYFRGELPTDIDLDQELAVIRNAWTKRLNLEP